MTRMDTVKQATKMYPIDNFLKATGKELESILAEKPGHHHIQGGIKSLLVEKIHGQLRKSAEMIVSEKVHTVAILVGSSSSMIMWPPTDTDGPGGAFALGNTIIQMGKKVIIVTDSVNSDQILPAFRNSILGKNSASNGDQVEFMVFDSSNSEENGNKFSQLFQTVDHIINVGRPGPSDSGKYWSHDGRDMTHYQPNFSHLFTLAQESKSSERQVWTTAIGELGNELGMGEIVSAVNLKVSEGVQIACHIGADFTIVSTTANWGAWGLCAMLTLVHIARTEAARYAPIEKFLPSVKDQSAILETLVKEECRCGVTMTRDLIVDNFSEEENKEFLENLCGFTRAHNADLGEIFERGQTKVESENEIEGHLVVTA